MHNFFPFSENFSCIGGYRKAKKRLYDNNDYCQHFPRWIMCAKTSDGKNQQKIRNTYSDFTQDMSL